LWVERGALLERHRMALEDKLLASLDAAEAAPE
jgi:hypothetical protein